MIQILDLGRSDLLAYRLSDILTDDDVRTATVAFDAALAAHETVHVYAEIEALHGAEARALWLDLVYGIRRLGAVRTLGRIAVVSDAGWVRRLARIEARLLSVGQLQTYGLADRDDARTWVTAAAPATAAAIPLAPRPLSELDAWLDAGGLDVAWADSMWFDEDWRDESLVALRTDRDEAPRRGQRPRAPHFGRTVHSTHALLNDVAERLGAERTVPAYRALRSVLHALRDHATPAEAAQLAAQLTTLVRGVFYEGYQPAAPRERADRASFLATVAERLLPSDAFSPEAAVAAVGGALAASVSPGEWSQVLHTLPHDVRALFEAPVAA